MHFRNLTHNEIVFRVLLQREDARPRLTFTELERTLPKQLRKAIESDWRGYIRDEGIEFDSAFQKAMRKHLPGVYYVVMAAEFLAQMPFHLALRCFLQPVPFNWSAHRLSEDEVFELAEFLIGEMRRQRSQGVQPEPTSRAKPELPITAKQMGETRRCGFCRRHILASELYDHIDRQHLNPPRLGVGSYVVAVPVARAESRPSAELTKSMSPAGQFSRFRRQRCIGCGSIPIPGDFYCYHCAPD